MANSDASFLHTEVQKAISFCGSLRNTRKFKISIERINPSSETQGRLAGARGNKSGKEMKRRRFTSRAEKAFSCKPATRRVRNCALLVANATKKFALATRISQLVASGRLTISCHDNETSSNFDFQPNRLK